MSGAADESFVQASVLTVPEGAAISRLVQNGSVTALYQPIVDLDSREVVAFEALARGPEGTELELPAQLFQEAKRHGVLGDLDRVCRGAAICGALEAGLSPPMTLFVNVEPATLSDDGPILSQEDAIRDRRIQVMVELTERDLSARPADVLAAVGWLRSHGCGVALDDVGVDERSLALLPILSPDVIKLDMRFVQEPGTSRKAAHVINACAAEVERSGTTLLAEGIETDEHLARARAMGATLGQGWLFGRPRELGPDDVKPPRGSGVSRRRILRPRQGTPFELVAGSRRTRRGDKRLLLALSRQLEAEALGLGDEGVLLATFQERKFFTERSRGRYAEIAQQAAFVGAIGVGLDTRPEFGVRGADLAHDDPLRSEWDVVVVGPHFAGAFVARDLGDEGPDSDRRFEFFVTYDRSLVLELARALMVRIAPSSAD